MLDLILTIALAIPTLLMAYLGGHMAVFPPSTVTSKRRYQWSFGILSFSSLALIIAIGIRQFRASHAAEAAQGRLNNELSQTKEAAERGEKQLGDLRKDNETLRTSLEKAQEVTIAGFKTILDEANRKHFENLDRFSKLLSDQEQLTKKTEVGIDRLLAPVSSEALISFRVRIPGSQKSVSHFVRRLQSMGKGSLIEPGETFPNAPEEVELYRFLSFVRLYASFEKQVRLDLFSTAPQQDIGGVRESPMANPEFTVVADAPVIDEKPKGFGSIGGDRYQVYIAYDSTNDEIEFNASNIRVDVTSTITSLRDLAGYSVVLGINFPTSKVRYSVDYFRFAPALGKPLVSTKFVTYYLGTTPFFIAKVP